MKKSASKYIYLILASMGFFVIIAYTRAEQEIEAYRWIITSGLTIYFMIMTFISIKNEFK